MQQEPSEAHKHELKRREANRLASENTLDYWHELFIRGVPLSDEKADQLIKSERIKDPLKVEALKLQQEQEKNALFTHHKKTSIVQDADNFIDVTRDDYGAVVKDDEYRKKREKFLYNGREIQKSDWAPKDTLIHDQAFIHWINSINSGFSNMVDFLPFKLYCQQADNWLSDMDSIQDHKHLEEKRKYAFNEFNRSGTNSLYFLDKYLKLKDGKDPSISGEDADDDNSYVSAPVHRVLCYLFDCGYSLCVGKPRQIAATSTFGGLAICKVMFQSTSFVKFITINEDKGNEIFEDKMKYPYSQIPPWMFAEVSNDTERHFRLKRKDKKGKAQGPNSSIRVVPPSISAINGGSPTVVMVDEAGYIRILGKMIKEARPTLFGKDKKTGNLKMKRQVVIWSTGGEMDKAGMEFETEYNYYWDQWYSGNHSVGIIPLFFDWTTRPGITREFYDREKEAYQSGGGEYFKGTSLEERLNQFKQHYPSTKDDMFLTSEKTLKSGYWIGEQLDRITKAEHKFESKFGAFEPVFDFDSPLENADVPYKITGANFVPCSDDEIHNAPVEMIFEPDRNWIHRYYMGTDPIQTDNGYSNMSSSMWDNYYQTISCRVNWRSSDHKEVFRQCHLMNLYYRPEGYEIKELIEMNAGTSYVDYKESKGDQYCLVENTELPASYRGGKTLLVGIDNHGNRSKFIIATMKSFYDIFGERLYSKQSFHQLRTFVCTVAASGIEKWGTKDPEKFRDDVLYSDTFAYICALSYDHEIPKEIKSDKDRYRTVYPVVRDKNGNLTRMAKREKIF